MRIINIIALLVLPLLSASSPETEPHHEVLQRYHEPYQLKIIHDEAIKVPPFRWSSVQKVAVKGWQRWLKANPEGSHHYNRLMELGEFLKDYKPIPRI